MAFVLFCSHFLFCSSLRSRIKIQNLQEKAKPQKDLKIIIDRAIIYLPIEQDYCQLPAERSLRLISSFFISEMSHTHKSEYWRRNWLGRE